MKKIWILSAVCGVTMFSISLIVAQNSDRTGQYKLLPMNTIRPEKPVTRASDVDLPHIDDWDKYKVDPFLRTAIALQSLGQEQAVQKLLERAKRRTNGYESEEYEVFILCRMLFTAKGSSSARDKKSEFRRPMLGGACFVDSKWSEANYAEWPLEPIELVDGIPFVITRGYDLDGMPESPTEYVNYCIQNCAWNTIRFKPKSEIEKQTALAKLISQHKLTPSSNRYELEFLSAQIK